MNLSKELIPVGAFSTTRGHRSEVQHAALRQINELFLIMINTKIH